MAIGPGRSGRATRRAATVRRVEIEKRGGSSSGERSWLLLTYKVPAEPAKRRIALWRKLKALGAVYLQSGVCLLPKVDPNVRRLKVLQNEISAMEGDAVRCSLRPWGSTARKSRR
jgi:hypothetical protein